MLKDDVVAKLATLAKIPAADLKAAITDTEEKDITIPENLTVLTTDEVTTLKTNEYNKGKGAAVELAVKDAKEKLGLEFQGKTIDGLIKAASEKALADAKLEPNAQITELKGQLETVKATAVTLQNQLAEKDKEITGVKINGELLKHIPAPGDNGPAIAGDDVIALMKANGYNFELKDGAVVAMKNGQLVQDNLSNPVKVSDVVTGFLKEKKLVTDAAAGPAGRGGGGSGKGVKATKLSELIKQYEAEGKHAAGQEFNEAVMKAKADNPEFDLNA